MSVFNAGAKQYQYVCCILENYAALPVIYTNGLEIANGIKSNKRTQDHTMYIKCWLWRMWVYSNSPPDGMMCSALSRPRPPLRGILTHRTAACFRCLYAHVYFTRPKCGPCTRFSSTALPLVSDSWKVSAAWQCAVERTSAMPFRLKLPKHRWRVWVYVIYFVGNTSRTIGKKNSSHQSHRTKAVDYGTQKDNHRDNHIYIIPNPSQTRTV